MEDRFFFNPYFFPGPFGPNPFPPNMTPPPNVMANSNNVGTEISPKEFYENQYHYYRYLNEFMDYQLKSREFNEKFNKTNNFNSSNKAV